MKERPILFSGPMVKAILAGNKTQTRRVIQCPERFSNIRDCGFASPYGVPGDRLWVRETWRADDFMPEETIYRTDGPAEAADCVPWRPSIFMPRRRSRITLEVTDVRVERLQEISGGDIAAETGWLTCHRGPSCRCMQEMFSPVWDRINSKRAPWALNPWVWAITFKRSGEARETRRKALA